MTAVDTQERPAAAEAPEPPREGRNFFVAWLGSALAVILAIGAINILVDPFLVSGSPRIKGFNAVKPEVETHGQLAKDYLVLRAHAQGVMLGSSKVDLGLNPLSPYWPADARPAFNYGVPGDGLPEIRRNLERAIAAGQVRRALILVDIDGIMTPDAPKPATSALQDLWRRDQDYLLALLSVDSLRGSLNTVSQQRARDVTDSSDLGQMTASRYQNRVATYGYDDVFVEKESGLFTRLGALAQALKAQPRAPFGGLDDLGQIIALCQRNGVALDIAISPYHADYLEVLRQAGLWPRYQAAEQALVRFVDQRSGGKAPVWDFLGYDAYSTEPVPRAGDIRAQTQWFWEPSHFKQALGDRILRVIYGGATDYGARLTPQTLAAHQAAQDQAAQAYEHSAPGYPARFARAARQGG